MALMELASIEPTTLIIVGFFIGIGIIIALVFSPFILFVVGLMIPPALFAAIGALVSVLFHQSSNTGAFFGAVVGVLWSMINVGHLFSSSNFENSPPLTSSSHKHLNSFVDDNDNNKINEENRRRTRETYFLLLLILIVASPVGGFYISNLYNHVDMYPIAAMAFFVAGICLMLIKLVIDRYRNH